MGGSESTDTAAYKEPSQKYKAVKECLYHRNLWENLKAYRKEIKEPSVSMLTIDDVESGNVYYLLPNCLITINFREQ